MSKSLQSSILRNTNPSSCKDRRQSSKIIRSQANGNLHAFALGHKPHFTNSQLGTHGWNGHAFQSEPRQNEKQRLSYKDIQNITKMMMKDKKMHQYNLGVLQSIKGKMYCLKLGQVSNFKQFSHYFYTSQYRRKVSKQQDQSSQLRFQKKVITEPSDSQQENQQGQQIHGYQIEEYEEQVRNFQSPENPIFTTMPIDQILKQKINKFILPTITNSSEKEVKNEEKEKSGGIEEKQLHQDTDPEGRYLRADRFKQNSKKVEDNLYRREKILGLGYSRGSQKSRKQARNSLANRIL